MIGLNLARDVGRATLRAINQHRIAQRARCGGQRMEQNKFRIPGGFGIRMGIGTDQCSAGQLKITPLDVIQIKPGTFNQMLAIDGEIG